MSDLEEQLRESLREHADRAGASTPVVHRAVASHQRRRRTRWATVAGVAAALVVAAAVMVPRLGTAGVGPVVDPAPDAATDPLPELPGKWRQELWGSISVDVPASWGYGAAPTSLDGEPMLCTDGTTGPYVGRPVMLSDVCGGSEDETPSADYLWFDAGLPVGVEDLGGGYVRQTIAEYGTTVTVATDDPELRQRILSTVVLQSTCPSELAQRPTSSAEVTATYLQDTDIADVRACTYRRGAEDRGWTLVFGATVPAGRVVPGLLAEAAQPAVTPRRGSSSQVTVLSVSVPTAVGEQAWAPYVVLDYGSGTVGIGGAARPIVAAGVRSWWPEGMRYAVASLGLGCDQSWSHAYTYGGVC